MVSEILFYKNAVVAQPVNSLLFWFFISLLISFLLAKKYLDYSVGTGGAYYFIFSVLFFVLPLLLLLFYTKNASTTVIFAPLSSFFFNLIGSIDSISVLFVFMVHVVDLMVLVFLVMFYKPLDQSTILSSKTALFALFLMTFILDILFLSTNLLVIFIAAEISLLPLSFLMLKENTIFWRTGFWPDFLGGGHFERLFENKRPLAFYYLIMFTVVSGGFGLIGLLFVYLNFGTLSIPELSFICLDIGSTATNNFMLRHNGFYDSLSIPVFFLIIWISVKVPLVPVHVWLPKAHVEGSTESSMLLAGIILKITTYVLLRLSAMPFFSVVFIQFEAFFISVSILTAIVGALGAVSTTDLKKITAYSSVSHMGLILASGFLISFSSFALQPYVLLLMTHTIISTAMFMVIGCIYKLRNTFLVSRNKLTYSGLLFVFPHFFLFGLLIFANLNIPLTVGFMGELGVLVSVVQLGFSSVALLLVGSFILLIPMVMIVAQVLLGPVRLFDYDFLFLLGRRSKNKNSSLLFTPNLRLFSQISYSNNYNKLYYKQFLFFTVISILIIGFGLFPFAFSHIVVSDYFSNPATVVARLF